MHLILTKLESTTVITTQKVSFLKSLSYETARLPGLKYFSTLGIGNRVSAKYVFNCTYSAINKIISASRLPIIPLKHELAEMALVEVPEPLKHLGITVMCGSFFSIMLFPPRGLHTLSHVRYTPHFYWQETEKFCR